jgi:hypothetical protein
MQSENEDDFYFIGWRTAFVGHDVQEFPSTIKESLKVIDGEFDICFVSPGFLNYELHLYRKTSKRTKYVLVSEEDMHQPIEFFRNAAEYYDLVVMLSEMNVKTLTRYGISNVMQILPCLNPKIFNNKGYENQHDVIFLGGYDECYLIQGSSRHQYLVAMESDQDIREFIGRGFYGHSANEFYNQCKIGVDLPIMSVVGPRTFQVGATGAMVMLPESSLRPDLWRENFCPGHDHVTFSGGLPGLLEAIKKWRDHPDRDKIVKNMNEKLLAGHTFEVRLKQILEKVL